MSGIPKKVQNARKGRYNRQTGLKMQGDANRVDLSRLARRAIKRRVHTTFKVKGYNSDYRCDHGIDPNTVSDEVKESYCYNVNEPGTVLLDPAPFHQSAAGGVGHIYHPRRRCNFKCSADPTPILPAHCNHVLDLESNIFPIKKVDKETGAITFDQEFCTVQFTWVRPSIWDKIGKDEKYNYLKVEFLEIKIMLEGSTTPVDIEYPTIINNSYTCKKPIKYNTNYKAEVINHCCCGIGIATINFPTGPPIPNPLPPSDCSTLSPCKDSDDTYWYGNVVGKPQNHKEDDASYGWGFSFNSSSDYEKNHVKYLNCINNWTFQIFPTGEEPISENAIKIFQTVTKAKNDNTFGKILNDADFLFFNGIFIYHIDNVKATDNKSIFYSEDPNFKQNTKYDLYINANVNSETKCSPERYGPITITTGKNITPPPPPPPTNPCSIINAPFTNWLGTFSAGNPINELPNQPQSFGFSIHWDDLSKITARSCISSWKFCYRNKSNPSSQFEHLIGFKFDPKENIDKFPRIFNFYDQKPSGMISFFESTSIVWEVENDALQPNTEYEIKIEAIPNISTSKTIVQEITVKTGTRHCNVNNFIGPITKTTINSESSNSNAFGFKIDIDDTKIPTSNISMLKDYQIDLFASGTTTPALFTKTISALAKIDTFEILKDCSGSTNVDNCFEFDLSQNTQYDIKITGNFNDNRVSIGSDIVNSTNYELDNDHNIKIKDSITTYSEYENFKVNFSNIYKNLDSITNGNKVRYSFKVEKNTSNLPQDDDNTNNPYFNTVWIGISDYQIDFSQDKRKIKEIDRDGDFIRYVGSGTDYPQNAGLRTRFYVAASITYNDTVTPNTYNVKLYNFDKSSNTLVSGSVFKIDIDDPNTLPELYFDIGEPINGETPVYFGHGSVLAPYKFSNTLNNNVAKDGYFTFFGTFGSKGIFINNLQFTPVVTDCSNPVKTMTVTSGKKPSPGPSPGPTPAPTPPPKPIYSKSMPQLYLTTYGNSAFNDLSKFIGQQDILSQLLVLNNVSAQTKDLFDKITQLKWYIIRDYNIRYFQKLKSFVTSKDNNFKNYMILIGDYLPLIPPNIQYNDTYDSLIVKNSGCSDNNKVQYGYSSLPYPLNSVNGPVDFGIPYGTKTPDLSYDLTSDSSADAKSAFKSVGCSLILDQIIPMAISNKTQGRMTTDIEITTNADITPNDSGWKTWDAGNYPVSKYNIRHSKIQRNSDGGYTITKPEFICITDPKTGEPIIQKIQPELAYFTVKPDKFNSNEFSSQITNNKLNTILQCEFQRNNGTPVNTIVYTQFQVGNENDLVEGMFVDFDVDLGLNKTTFKKADQNNTQPIRVQSIDTTNDTITLNQDVIFEEGGSDILFISNYYSGGNIFIGDGSGLDISGANPTARIEPGFGCGRSSHFKPNGNNIDFIDLSKNDINFYNYGNGTQLQGVIYGVNSFPLDNLHQYFITVYFINQKIMELNYYIKTGKLKFAVTNGTWNEGDLLPLITHIHSDRESASPYAGNQGPYPSCDSSGNILLSGTLPGGAAGTGGGLGDTVSVGYWKYLYNKYMPAECLPVWRRDIDHNIHHSDQLNIMNVPATQGTSNGIKVPNTSEILWDQSKPWNIDQRRNFHEDASSNSTPPRGYTITSNDLHSVKKGDSTDGIQRYQTGWINTKTTAYLENTGEGLLEAYQEIYNLGEVKPPVSFATINDYDKIMDDFVTIKENNENLLEIQYGPKYTLPDKPTSGNIIIQNSLGTFGSGIIPGSDFPPSKGNNGNSNGLSKQLHYRLNSINNSLIGRIAKKYGTDEVNKFIGASSIKGLEDYRSPALSDLWMRQMAKEYNENPPDSNFALPAVPFDGRGFKSDSGKTAGVDISETENRTTGMNSSIILNLSKNTDGYYLPIDVSFCDLSTGEINLSDIYDSSVLDNKFWGTQNSTAPGSGPQEAIATFSFEYQSGATGIDPRLPMPGGMNETINGTWSDKAYLNKFATNQLAFTDKGRTFATKIYADMGQSYFTSSSIVNIFNSLGKGDYTAAASNIMGDPANQQTKIFILPGCENAGNCTNYSGQDLIFSGLDDATINTQFQQPIDGYGISHGWTPNSNSFGGETNILSSLGVTSFTPMKNFIKASAICMGGVDNIGKIKVGLYSQEFLPIGWLSGVKDHDI